jgi:hypothetical protein
MYVLIFIFAAVTMYVEFYSEFTLSRSSPYSVVATPNSFIVDLYVSFVSCSEEK